MKEFFEWHHETMGKKAVEALKKNHFNACYCKDGQEALEKILELVPREAVIGVGGSWTVAELGIVKELEARGHKILNHGKPGLSPEEKIEIRRGQLTSDVFLTGSNAITMDGQLVERGRVREQGGGNDIWPREGDRCGRDQQAGERC